MTDQTDIASAPRVGRIGSPPAGGQVIVVAGRSGAGRSSALAALEDIGFETVDTPPLAFVPGIVREMLEGGQSAIAIGVGAKTLGLTSKGVSEILARLRALSGDVTLGLPTFDVAMVYLDCADEILRRRYTETRRRHPLAPGGSVDEGIAQDAAKSAPLKAHADLSIDTSNMTGKDLKRALQARFERSAAGVGMSIMAMSFSYKIDVPQEADMVFDCRFLRNPHYEETLRQFDGRDPRVAQYVAEDPLYERFFAQVLDLAKMLFPAFQAEGKSYLTVAFGCTGGKHRSVALAEAFADGMRADGWRIRVRHRDRPVRAGDEMDGATPSKEQTSAA